MVDKKKNRGLELVRFLICGLASALTDYLFCQLMILALPESIGFVWITVISTAVGFIFGVTVNYIISTFWVYQNVDKSINTKSKKFVALFVLLSFCALLLSVGVMLVCGIVVRSAWSFEIVEFSLMELIQDNGISFLALGIFWAYFVSFCIKTLVGLVFNYLTRKFILYKEPKEKE